MTVTPLRAERPRTNEDGEWVSWAIDGRAGAKLRLGPVFLGEISYPHDFGLGARWRAWLNQEHLGFFRNEAEARARIESEMVKRLRLMLPAWSRFRRARKQIRLAAPAGREQLRGRGALLCVAQQDKPVREAAC